MLEHWTAGLRRSVTGLNTNAQLIHPLLLGQQIRQLFGCRPIAGIGGDVQDGDGLIFTRLLGQQVGQSPCRGPITGASAETQLIHPSLPNQQAYAAR